MKSFSKTVSGLVALALLASMAAAQKPKAKTAAPATCPACKMTLSKKKDKDHTVAVKTKHGTLYCCAGCKMNAKPKKKGK